MLTISFRFTHNGVVLDNFYCYRMKYANFENDPYPHVLSLYRIKGTNPMTGNYWNLWQCINLNYIPRAKRRAFVKDAKDILMRSKSDFKIMWKFLMMKYPYLKIATRRYYLNPSSYIQKLEYIPPEKMEEELVRNIYKDYSMAAFRKLGRNYRKTHPKPGKR